MFALAVVVWAAGRGAARLGGGAGSAYVGLFLIDRLEVEGFGAERLGGCCISGISGSE